MYKSGAEMYLQTAFFTFDKKIIKYYLKKVTSSFFCV